MSLLVNSDRRFMQNPEIYSDFPSQFYAANQFQPAGDYFYPLSQTQNFQPQIQNYQILPEHYSTGQNFQNNNQQGQGNQSRFANALNQNFLQSLNTSGFSSLQRRGYYQGGSVFVSSPEHHQTFPGFYNNDQSITESNPSQISPAHHNSSASVISTPEPSPNFLQYQWEGLNTSSTEEKYLPAQDVSRLDKSNPGFQNNAISSTQSSSGVSANQDQDHDQYVIKDVQYSQGSSDELIIQVDTNAATNCSNIFQQTTSSSNQNWNNNDDDDDFGSRNAAEIGINLEDIPDSLPDLKDSDILLSIPHPDVPAQVSLSNLIDNCLFNKSDQSNQQRSLSKPPKVLINIQARSSILRRSPDVFDDHDEDLDKCFAYPAGSAEQTKALASSQFMKKLRSHIDFLKATQGPILPISTLYPGEQKSAPGKLVQPQRRHIKKEENAGSIPDVIQMDLTKLGDTKSFSFGSKEWTLSFDRNPKFKKFFFEGNNNVFTLYLK